MFKRRDYTHSVTDDEFHVVKCVKCGFVFVNPRPNIHEIHAYYTDEFYLSHLTAEQLLAETRVRNKAKCAMIGRFNPGRLLDIGCQKGEFLYEAQRNGWQVNGIEFSDKPPNLFHLPIFYGSVEEAPYPADYFDLVTMWAVLEHVHDPRSTLSYIRRVLKKQGRAFVLVPNFNSIPGRLMRHDDVPRHLVMFTPDTFKRMAEEEGFRVVRTVFSNDIFSGSCRGVLNFLYKMLRGESLEEIVAQNRQPGRWSEFSNCVNGTLSNVMLKVDRFDIWLSQYLDHLVNKLGFGFIMTVEIAPHDSRPSTILD